MLGVTISAVLRRGIASYQVLWLLRLVGWSALRIILVLMSLVIGFALAGHWLHLNAEPDPLLTYQMLLPGESRENLAAYGCAASVSVLDRPPVKSSSLCNFVPRNDLFFHLISIEMAGDHIKSTTFYSRFLHVEQLMELWDYPQSISRSSDQQTFVLSWLRDDYSITAVLERPLGSRTVRMVTFTQR